MTMLGLKRSTVTSLSSLPLRSCTDDSDRSITGATSGYATWWRMTNSDEPVHSKFCSLCCFFSPLKCSKLLEEWETWISKVKRTWKAESKTIYNLQCRRTDISHSPRSEERFSPSPVASSPSSEAQSAPGGKFSPPPGSASANGKPRRRSPDPGRPLQRSCRTERMRNQAGRLDRKAGDEVRSGEVRWGQVKVGYLQLITGFSGCLMGKLSSSISGPLR